MPSVIIHRLKNTENLDSIVKRLEYSRNIEMYNFLDPDIVLKDDLIELEFILLTSSRYNAVFMWDYSDDEKKENSYVYMKLNSKNVNHIFEILSNNMKVDLKQKFYSFKPERRENDLLNHCISNIVKNLNEANNENEFNNNALNFEPKDECKRSEEHTSELQSQR